MDMKVNVKIILSALWVARMLSSLQGDVVRFMQPGMLEEMMAGTFSMICSPEIKLTTLEKSY